MRFVEKNEQRQLDTRDFIKENPFRYVSFYVFGIEDYHGVSMSSL